MSFATIMVYVDAEHPSRNRIELAADLAKRHNSTLIGVSALLLPAEMLSGGTAAVATVGSNIETRVAAAGELFRDIAGRQQLRLEWRPFPDPPLGVLVREARAADLIVIPSNPQGVDYSAPDAGDAVMQLGRPALLVPRGVARLSGDRVVVGWTDSREARRAVHDALPFLHEASDVTVIELCEPPDAARAKSRLDDVVHFLTRHRIKASSKAIYPIEGSGAGQLVKAAQNVGADLLVTGAYGSGRIGEWILGGMSRDLIKHSPICCVMSH